MNATRRTFLQLSLAAALPAPAFGQSKPWYQRTYRWGQTNITEEDPIQYDIPWWRDYWKRTEVQGVIINAGGIVAYYPSRFPLQHRAQFLNGRDLFGELTDAAHRDGIVVMARMDSSRTSGDFFQAHPDWFARTADGQPYRAGDQYTTCINSAYYEEYLPEVLREIIQRSKPEGFTDNSWAGLGRSSICYCENCQRKFRDKASQALPRRANWDDPVYRQWILWSYARRTDLWEFNNRVTQQAGGADCIWSGMNSGSVTSEASSFRDLRDICKRAQILMLDHQARTDAGGFQQNSDTGARVHGVLDNQLAIESMAMYENGRTNFRLSAKPAAEARMWMVAGMAGGIQPWWHHVGAYQEDPRAYATAEPVMKWQKANEAFLADRRPIATVGVLWSQRNTDFYGRDSAADVVDAPYDGWMQALIRARIPYCPVHADDLDSATALKTLILPNVGGLSDTQCAAIRRFVAGGGSLIATGESSLYNEFGDPREDFALADLLRVHTTGKPPAVRRAGQSSQTYLRLHPELRARANAPKSGKEPAAQGQRHPALAGFDQTDILPLGGTLQPMKVDPEATVLATFIPDFPAFPPETAWMRTTDTDIPALVVNETAAGSRIAYLSADLDRRYQRELLPDHADLLANLVRWTDRGSIPLSVKGPGLIDCRLYSQPGRLIAHFVNLTSAATWRAPVDELIPVGPLQVRVKFSGRTVKRLVSGGTSPLTVKNGWVEFELKSILDHEVVVIA